ncbi:hypothetical protein FJR38_13995 [Anabaena sp. UHCC 0253]|uniref:hypothetical protein n=1 Tax=Anabaena sp. UHCC 0253 TaxID=2590019 RepID=UPI001444F61C|nr:hypothetical protein [Anabaena sp. UHCC 0253]MTJ53679.1 hypothetical protein [Anabaena sp. UHCC 0253]
MIIAIGIVAIFFLLYLSALDWKKSVFFVLVFLVLEGVVRKWIWPQASQYIYFIKDIVLIGAYIKYFLIEGKKIKKHGINILIYFLAIWSFVQAFNPSLGSSIIGLFGLRGYLLYIPLFWILTDLFSTKMDLYKFIRNYSLLIIPVCLLAVAQFFSPPSSPLNFYATGADQIATFGVGGEAIARVTGTFPYITGFGTYLCTSLTLLIPLLLLRQPLIWYYLTIFELLLVLGTSFMTGSRAVVLYQGLFLISYILILLSTHSKQAFLNLKKFILPAIAVTVIVPTYFSKSIDLLSQRSIQNSKEGVDRILQPFIEPLSTIPEIIKLKQIDSYGTGATHQATQLLRTSLNLPQGDTLPPIGEIEPPRVIIEIGVIGFVLFYWIRINLIICLGLTSIKLRDPFLSQVGIAAFLFHTLQITSPVVFNPNMGIYYWFFAGFILLLPELERREKSEYLYYQEYQKTKS